jgi:hypothetical protein
MLRKLVDQGYLTIEGKIGENVLPTVAAMRWQDAKSSDREAKAILRPQSRSFRGFLELFLCDDQQIRL